MNYFTVYGSLRSVHGSLLPEHGISVKVDFTSLTSCEVMYIDVSLFPMPFAVPFELNMFVPFEFESRYVEIPCEVHFAIHSLSNGTHRYAKRTAMLNLSCDHDQRRVIT